MERINWKFETETILFFENNEFEVRLNGDKDEVVLSWYWKANDQDYIKVFKNTGILEIEKFLIENILNDPEAE